MSTARRRIPRKAGAARRRAGVLGRGTCALLAFVLSSGALAGVPAAQGQRNEITLEDLLGIAHPGPPVWSPSGERVAFVRELDGALDLWWTTEQLDEPVAVTHAGEHEPPARVAGFAWTAASDALIYALRGDLFVYRIDERSSEPLTSGETDDTSPVLTTDGTRLAFLRDGQIWVGVFPELEGAVITDEPASFRGLRWSPDGRYLAATYGDAETVLEDTGALMGDKVRFARRQPTAGGLAVIEVDSGTLHRVEEGPAYAEGADFSAAGVLAWQEISPDAKRRTILVAAAPDWSPRVVIDEPDDAWWTLTYLDAGPRWSPVRECFVFVSERDGWAHAWLLEVAADGGDRLVQLTRGEFEVEEPQWSPDGTRLLLSANRGSSSERGLQLLDVPAGVTAPPEMEPISRLRGTSTFGRWRPDGRAIGFLHADPENPLDLWVQEDGPVEARQLSDSWPEGVDERELVRPQRARFSSSDGTLVPAQLFLPRDASEEPLPALVWAHGGGIRQNRYGWHPMRAYAVFYGFQQYLLQRGYAVVTVDYRGSIGYGRAFRQGQYLDLGGRDLDDVLAAARYLRRIEDVEIGKIGVWGISYGGYLTVQALVAAPTAFDAGVDVAGVVDWADWAVDPGGLWIDGRMGPVAANPEIYRRSSPINRVEQIARPLLILHGTADRNVPVLQSFELTDALVRNGKRFDVVIYPGEEHAFARAHTWLDAFRRIESFFDAHLR